MRESVIFAETTDVVKIPQGDTVTIEEGTEGFLVQLRGGNATVRIPSELWQVQLENEQLDVLEKPNGDDLDLETQSRTTEFDDPPEDEETVREAVFNQLSQCYDPEIPVNIVDLGLIYGVKVTANGNEAYQVEVDMTLTAEGCGMGKYLAQDAESKIRSIPGVKTVDVEIVWDPRWNENMMTDEARRKLGL